MKMHWGLVLAKVGTYYWIRLACFQEHCDNGSIVPKIPAKAVQFSGFGLPSCDNEFRGVRSKNKPKKKYLMITFPFGSNLAPITGCLDQNLWLRVCSFDP